MTAEELSHWAIRLEGMYGNLATDYEKQRLKTIINFPNSDPTPEMLAEAEEFLREFQKKHGPDIETYSGPKDSDTN